MPEGGFLPQYKLQKLFFTLLLSLFFSTLTYPYALSQTTTEQASLIEVYTNEATAIDTPGIKRFLILNPEVATAKIASPETLEVTGIKPGETLIHIWSSQGLSTLRIKVDIKELRIIREREIRQEAEAEKVPGLRLDYYYEYQMRGSDEEVPRTRQQEKTEDHTLTLIGPTPYGRLDANLLIERRRYLVLQGSDNATKYHTYDKNMTVKLLGGNVGPLRNFDFVFGDNYISLSSLAFAGYRFRGVTYGSSGHLDNLNSKELKQPLEFTFFGGRSRLGGTTGLAAGTDKKQDLFYTGLRTDYQLNPNTRIFSTWVNKEGTLKDQRSSYTYSAGTKFNSEILDLDAELARDRTDSAFKTTSNIKPAKNLRIGTEFRDIQKGFFTTAGAPSEQGVRGAKIDADLSFFERLNLSGKADYYKDHTSLSVTKPKHFNLVYGGSASLTSPSGKTFLSGNFQKTDRTGTNSPSREESWYLKISKPMLLQQAFIIKGLSPYYLYEFRQAKRLGSPTDDYKNRKQEMGLGFSLPFGFFYTTSYQYNSLIEIYNDIRSSPLQWINTLSFSQQILKTFSFGANIGFTKVENTESTLSFISAQDAINGGVSLGFNPSPEANFYLRGSFNHNQPEDELAAHSSDINVDAGGHLFFDNVIRIPPSGRINGVVFRDLNKNGLQDTGETGIGDVVVALDNKKLAITDEDGTYTLSGRGKEVKVNLDPESLPSGYVFTTPSIQMASIDPLEAAEVNFGVISRTIIRGFVFADENDNGTFDKSDFPLSDIPITLQSGQNTKTSLEGRYEFQGLAPGENEISIPLLKLPVGYTILGKSKIKLDIADGSTQKIDFPIKIQRIVTGYVFEDTNGNGAFDKGEKTLVDVRLDLDLLPAKTESDGRYLFTDLRAGKYKLSVAPENLPQNYTLVKPEVEIELTQGPITKDVNFPLKKSDGAAGV